MKKKVLLKLIEELQIKVALLETKVTMLQSPSITIPNGITFGTFTMCQHEYPAGPTWSTVPPTCKKCGQQMPTWTVGSICTTSSTGGFDSAHISGAFGSKN